MDIARHSTRRASSRRHSTQRASSRSWLVAELARPSRGDSTDSPRSCLFGDWLAGRAATVSGTGIRRGRVARLGGATHGSSTGRRWRRPRTRRASSQTGRASSRPHSELGEPVRRASSRTGRPLPLIVRREPLPLIVRPAQHYEREWSETHGGGPVTDVAAQWVGGEAEFRATGTSAELYEGGRRRVHKYYSCGFAGSFRSHVSA